MTDWKDGLKKLFEAQSSGEMSVDAGAEAEVRKFYSSCVKPAFKELRKELRRYGREITIDVGDDHASINVRFQGHLELNYRILVRGTRPHSESYYHVPSGEGLRSESTFKQGARPAEISDLSKDDIINDFLREYGSSRVAVKPFSTGNEKRRAT